MCVCGGAAYAIKYTLSLFTKLISFALHTRESIVYIYSVELRVQPERFMHCYLSIGESGSGCDDAVTMRCYVLMEISNPCVLSNGVCT